MRGFPLSRIAGLCSHALSVVLLCGPALAADPVAPSKAPEKAPNTPQGNLVKTAVDSTASSTKSPNDATKTPQGKLVTMQAPPPEPPPETPEPRTTVPPTATPSSIAPVSVPTPSGQAAPATSASQPAAPTLGEAGAAASTAAAAAERPNNPIIPQTSSNVVSGGEAQTRNATDVGSLLGKSISDPGVVIQRRNPIVSDPRIRGQHVGQINTQADGGFWIPSRLDLDTIVSKIDSSNIRDIIIIKGPYSVHYGPGFSFLDIVTTDSPRYENGFEAHSRTILDYQTNGTGWNGRESVWGGGSDWGFRLGYGIRAGIDYVAGNGYDVPASYNSQDLNFALGFTFSEDTKLELKGLRQAQKNVEFPGMYFDINSLETDSYTIRYTMANQDYFDRFNIDLWYNRTGADGNTNQGAKQVFLTSFLGSQPGFTTFSTPPQPALLTPINLVTNMAVTDRSLTNFNQMSRGYRMALGWGEEDRIQLTAGNDLTYVDQLLTETILIQRNPAFIPNPDPLQAIPPTLVNQNLGIPKSSSADPGFFLEGVVPVSDRIKFKGGVRYDMYFTQSDNRFVSGNVALFPGTPGNPSVRGFDPIVFSSNPNDTNLARHIGLFSTYLTGEYNITEHLTALGGIGYAQRPPTLTELYAAGPFINLLQQGLTRIVGDPHLLPEKMRQMDLGAKGNYGWFRGGVNGFYAWIDDYITYNQVTNATPYNVTPNSLTGTITGGSNSVVFTNTPRAILAGGELYGQAELTTWLTPFGTLAYVQGRDLSHNVNKQVGLVNSRSGIAQEALPGIPPLQGVTGLRFHNTGATPVWNIELSTLMVSGQDLVAATLDELPTPGYTIWNIRGYWQVNQNVLVTAGVENFGNKFYRSHLDPRSGSPTDVLFQPGRNFYFGTQLQY